MKYLLLTLILSAAGQPAWSSDLDEAMSAMQAIEHRLDTSTLDTARSSLLRIKAWEEAFWIIKMIAKMDPENPDAQKRLGYVYYKTSRWQEAIAHYESLSDSSTSRETDPILAFAYTRTGNFGKAASKYAGILDSEVRLGGSTHSTSAGALSMCLELIVRAMAAGQVEEVRPLTVTIRDLMKTWLSTPGQETRAREVLDLLDRVDPE